LEIVTEPDMNSAAEVRALAVELQRLVRYLGVSEADMQKGHMRFEPNVNLIVTKDGAEYKTPIVEIKNLNSFRALEKSVDYEVTRQIDEFLQTGKTLETGTKSTRGWDDVKEVTVLQREKEDAPDYRYFPDPDLVPVQLTQEWLRDIKSRLCELPAHKQLRFVNEYGLSDYDAGVLAAERSTAEFFEQAVAAGGEPKRLCNLITQDYQRLANERRCRVAELGVTPQRVAELARMIVTGQVSATASSTIAALTVADLSKTVEQIAQEHNLIQKSDAGELEAVVGQVLAENPKAVEDVTRAGKKSEKARSFLLGQVMQKTKGRANPKVVSQILARKLG
jgi:aspartyl-tRNA(Asn)/glutamyl-tRNA(Gln) amidotransferase subunit B